MSAIRYIEGMEYGIDTIETRLAVRLGTGLDQPRRTIYISGDIDLPMAHRVIMALQMLDAEDGDIRIILNSTGGDEEQGYAIYDAITACRNKVVIDGYGEVLSIAAAIMQAGTVRRLSANAMFMIHNGTAPEYTDLKHDDAIAFGKLLEKKGRRYHVILSNGSRQPVEVIEEWCKNDHYLLADEALRDGFCDENPQPHPPQGRPAPKRRKKGTPK